MGIVSIKKYNCEIEDGPNRDRLLDSLKHALDDQVIIPISFAISNRLDEKSIQHFKVKDVIITAFKYDVDSKHYHKEHDQSGQYEQYQCSLEGIMQVCLHPDALCGGNLHMTYKRCSFNANYNTHTREGRMIITIYEKHPG